MKTFAGLILLMSLKVFAGEGAGGHGGDPFQVYASAYPDQSKLENGLDLALDKLQASGFSEDFKKEVEQEFKELAVSEKFLYLENILIVQTENTDTYRLPKDLRTFTSLGAMTGEEKGSPVYLSKKTLSYGNESMGKILLHEVLHHTLPKSLSAHEAFVNDLVEGIFANKNIDSLAAALEERVYINKNSSLSLWQMFSSKRFEGRMAGTCKVLKKSEQDCKNRFNKLLINLQQLPFDNSKMEINTALSIVANEIDKAFEPNLNYSFQPNFHLRYLRTHFGAGKSEDNFSYCKKPLTKKNFWSTPVCLPENQVSLKEYIFGY